MKSTDLDLGVDYAYRPQPHSREMEVRRVSFVGPAKSGKAKVRHCDGDLADLEEWVPTRTLLCRWSARAAFLRDERREAALSAVTREEYDEVEADAISCVFEATGEMGGFIRDWVISRSQAERLWARAKIEEPPTAHPLSYVDRDGDLHLPYATAREFAERFAAAEPETVGLYVQQLESELEAQGWEPGNRHSHDFLRRQRPAYALARQWAGRGEVEVLRKEIKRLRELASQSMYELKRAGADDAARRIERGLAGG